MRNMFKKHEGDFGETIAISYLQEHGYAIITRNFRIRGGEIDIIAIDNDTLAFIEVKTRKSYEFGTPFEAISYRKIRSLVKTAQVYKSRHPKLPELLRIDAIGIILNEQNKPIKIDLVKNIS